MAEDGKGSEERGGAGQGTGELTETPALSGDAPRRTVVPWVVFGGLLVAVVGFVALAGFGVFLLRDSPIWPKPPREVPGVVGKSSEEAARILHAAEFRVDEDPRRSPEEDVGTVLDQDPAAGSLEDAGSTVTIAPGSPVGEVPNLVGATEEAAGERVAEDFQIGVQNVEVAGGRPGAVISQRPRPGKLVPWDTTISVILSAGQPPSPGDIYGDDFSDTSYSDSVGGWYTGEDDSGYTVSYDDGGLRIYNAPESEFAASSNAYAVGSVRDVIIEVDTRMVGGDPGEAGVTSWGITCRTTSDGRGNYRTGILDSGYAQIIKFPREGDSTVLDEGFYDAAIRSDANRLRVDCVGDRISLYVNGQRLLEARDGEIAQGTVGLSVSYGSEEPPGATILFDDFQVSTPP